MTLQLLTSFAFIVLLGAMLPGPNGLLITTRAITQGKIAALITLSGTLAAFYAHGLFSVIGLSALIFSSAKLFSLFKLVGAGYLVYLGVTLLWQAFSCLKSADDKILVKPVLPVSNSKLFIQGFLTNLLNPKVTLFYLALFPQFVVNSANLVETTLILVTIQIVIVGCWFTSLAMVAAKLSNNTQSHYLRGLRGLFGSLMLWFGINLSKTGV